MRHLWVVLALCASCKARKHADEGAPAAPIPPPAPGRGIGSPLPEKGPHPDYPTAAAAGTDKLFFLEEPDRGARAPASYTPPPRASLTWTTSPYCEDDPLGVSCGSGPVGDGVSWQIGRGAGVTIAEQLYSGRIHQTFVYLTANGTPTQQLHIDENGQLDEARLFTAPGRFSGRKSDGSNALHGCGMLAYELDKQQHLAELRCLQWLGEPMRNTFGFAVHRFKNDALGLTIERTRFGLDGAAVNGLDGVHRSVFTRDASGRPTLEQYFDAEGKRTTNLDGCAGERTTWADNGRIATTTCVDRNDAPMKNSDGVTTERVDYNLGNCIRRIRYLDATGAPTTDHLGVHRYDYETDSKCQDQGVLCMGITGKPVACGPGRPHDEIHRRDARGYIMWTRHYAPDGRATGDANYGVHELRYAHDANGNLIETTCFDAKETAVMCGTTGFHGKLATFDDAGRVSSQTFIDRNRKPTTNMGVPQRRFRYDNYNHEYEARNVDADGKLVESAGFAVRRNLWDATHQLFAVQLLDADRKPARYVGCYTGSTCPDTAWHAVRINRRPSGAVESNQFFDADGQLMKTIDCSTKPCFDSD